MIFSKVFYSCMTLMFLLHISFAFSTGGKCVNKFGSENRESLRERLMQLLEGEDPLIFSLNHSFLSVFRLISIPAGKKVYVIEQLTLEELNRLPVDVKQALIRREWNGGSHMKEPVPLFFVNPTQHFKKISYLIRYLEPVQISSAKPALREEIIRKMPPEDKKDLSDEQLTSLAKGTSFEMIGS